MGEQSQRPEQLDSKVQMRLDDLKSKLLMVGSYRIAWSRLLTDEERRELGPTIVDCGQRIPDVVQLWMELRGVSQPWAVVDLAHELSFIDTAEHDRLLRQMGEDEKVTEATPKPVWDSARRELRYRGRAVRRVRSKPVSKTISSILDAFQEADWPPRIDHLIDVSVSPQPLHDAVRSLNRSLGGIRFHVDGDYIFWTEC